MAKAKVVEPKYLCNKFNPLGSICLELFEGTMIFGKCCFIMYLPGDA